ncbi:MAG TPA: glycosyltransferase family 2 protein [Solirubrobacteraceae bacterium]|nr:glycosyltransferase family 2 protein [Solirubrobacteraceae bacterium]
MPRERISACLIVQNEQERLAAALQSVSFCDETIVVDGGSSDRTVEIARAAGAVVIENPWPGFAAQRNLALDRATGDWVFEIDADERVSERLRTSIESLLAAKASDVQIAACALRNNFLGAPLGPSAKYPAYRNRMFRRGAYRHDEGRMVHEGIEPHRRPFVLEGDLEHELAGTLGEALGDAWRYAQLESAHLAQPNPQTYVSGILLRPSAKLLYRTIFDRGWRDGWRGLVKIGLDVASDALVWMLVLTRKGSTQSAPAANESASTDHFGRRPTGPVKVVATAYGARDAQRASNWLTGLRAQGLDVALIAGGADAQQPRSTDEQPDADVPTTTLARFGPLAVMHALDVERQLRTTDAVVPVGRRARLIDRLLPRTLRPGVAGLNIALPPEQAHELLGSRGKAR